MGSKSESSGRRMFLCLGERLVAPDAVHRDAEHRSVVALELRREFLVEHHLVRADRAPVGRVEGQDHRLTAKVGELELLFWSGGKPEVWCLRAGSKRL